jgi:hypothetical protein
MFCLFYFKPPPVLLLLLPETAVELAPVSGNVVQMKNMEATSLLMYTLIL